MLEKLGWSGTLHNDHKHEKQRDGFRRELGWREVAGSAAARAEAGKHEKYGDLVRAARAARFETACVEDFGAFGKGALDVLE